MNISDLSHLEEVVSEAPSIVGGEVTKESYTTTADQLVSDLLLKLLSPESITLLKNTEVEVNTVTLKSDGAVASATIATT